MPLGRILQMIKKATKFDFSEVRGGTISKNRSIVTEVRNTQDHFIEMLQTFAKALKDNKALMTGRVSTASGRKASESTESASQSKQAQSATVMA
ncbi:hypothetical protein HDU93_004177 [Gonapodya sp. JEL0774]|nr:hypothetical protein HDU93_004177 [Gonapodya sp. JEL0774]